MFSGDHDCYQYAVAHKRYPLLHIEAGILYQMRFIFAFPLQTYAAITSVGKYHWYNWVDTRRPFCTSFASTDRKQILRFL
jgi:hypothetical protein